MISSMGIPLSLPPCPARCMTLSLSTSITNSCAMCLRMTRALSSSMPLNPTENRPNLSQQVPIPKLTQNPLPDQWANHTSTESYPNQPHSHFHHIPLPNQHTPAYYVPTAHPPTRLEWYPWGQVLQLHIVFIGEANHLPANTLLQRLCYTQTSVLHKSTALMGDRLVWPALLARANTNKRTAGSNLEGGGAEGGGAEGGGAEGRGRGGSGRGGRDRGGRDRGNTGRGCNI